MDRPLQFTPLPLPLNGLAISGGTFIEASHIVTIFLPTCEINFIIIIIRWKI